MGKSCVHKDYAMKLVGMTMTIYDYAMKLLRISLYHFGLFWLMLFAAQIHRTVHLHMWNCVCKRYTMHTEFMDVSWVIKGTYYMVKCFDCLYVVIPEVHWYMMVYGLRAKRAVRVLVFRRSKLFFFVSLIYRVRRPQPK